MRHDDGLMHQRDRDNGVAQGGVEDQSTCLETLIPTHTPFATIQLLAHPSLGLSATSATFERIHAI